MQNSVLEPQTLVGPLQQGPFPLYYQLGQRLRARISAGEFTPGSALPTEDQISREYKVSRITVRRALDGMQRQGLIETRRGLGSFIAERRQGMNNHLTGSLDEFLARAGSLSTSSISLGEATPSASVRAGLGLGAKESATLLRTLGSLDGLPVAYLEIWVPNGIGESLLCEDLDPNMPIVRKIEQVAKVRITRAEQTIEPDHAGDDAARYLHIDPKTPILHVRRIYFAGDRPIELADVRYHPDRYRYAVELKS